jgi:crotonobetainyl-CoA:carnitine CoA-transferase CaiB-like acyl-CoA transferase
MQEVWDHPQLQARGRWREVGSPVGTLPALLPPGSWDDGDPRLDPVPALGEHTDAILAELGLDAAAIDALRAAEAI